MFIIKKDRIDHRDMIYSFKKDVPLKQYVDLRPYASAIEDQLHLGSCVGQAVVGAYELMIRKLYIDQFIDLSRLFVYYNARALDNSVDEDVGSYTRDGVKALHKWGVCSENIWPYLIDRFAESPSIAAYEDALTRTISNYYRLITVDDMLQALNQEYPVVTSMNVYNTFYDLSIPGESLLKMPTEFDDIVGGHAVVFVGYDLNNKTFIVRNSFGESWGLNGYFFVPFEYVKNDFMDSWIFDINIKSIS